MSLPSVSQSVASCPAHISEISVFAVAHRTLSPPGPELGTDAFPSVAAALQFLLVERVGEQLQLVRLIDHDHRPSRETGPSLLIAIRTRATCNRRSVVT